MIDYALKDLLLRSDTDKQLRIRSDIGNITNADLESGTFTLNESLCDDDYLRFGACVPSSISFTVHNTVLPLINKKLMVDLMLNGKSTERLDIGEYFVTADTPTADRKKRNVTAYDALYKVINTDVADWYNSFFPNTNTRKTVKQLRDSFFAYFGIAQKEQTLVNDSVVVSKTIQPEELSGKVVAEAICEINGCFGHIGRDGKMQYVELEQGIIGIYPSNELFPSDELFPRSATGEFISKQTYVPPCEYESHLVQGITGLQIRKEENDVGVTVGTSDNQYVIQNNFLVYGKSSDELTTIANNIMERIRMIIYRPFRVKAKGNPCLEVGDAVRLNTSEQKIESYIMQRTIKGVQQMFDEYTARGREYLPKKLNSTKEQIRELQGRTLKIIKENDEFRILMENTVTGLEEEIAVLEGNIKLRVTRGQVESMIEVALDEVTISSDQISLEGYTTINGNFSIDESGNAKISGNSRSAQMTSNGFEISQNNSQRRLVLSDSAMILYGQYGSAKLLQFLDNNNDVFFGSRNGSYNFSIDCDVAICTSLNCTRINGYTPITSGNIGDYIADLESRIAALENKGG